MPIARRSAVVVATVLLAVCMLGLLSGVAAATGKTTYSAEEIALVNLINNYRAQNGMNALLVSDLLSDAAWKHSHDMGTYKFFQHDTWDSDWFAPSSNPGDRMVACGFPAGHAWGENIGAGYSTASQMFEAWVESDAHNKNMLSAEWKAIGVGCVTIPGSPWDTYWTTDFSNFVDGTAHQNGQPAPADTTAPTVSIDYPRDGAALTGSVSVQVTATDNIAVTKVELYANGAWIATSYASPYVIIWDTSPLSPGTYVLEARAYDAAGNIGTSRITVPVRNDNPTTTTNSSSTTTTTTTTTTSTSTTTTSTTTTSTTTTSTTSTTTSTTLPTPTFPDVTPSSPFYHAVTVLAGDGVVSGFKDGLFRPNVLVTRAEFAKIVVLALGKHTPAIDKADHPTFRDVHYAGSAYPFDYVEEAAGLKIIEGYSDGTFRPGADITRLQLAMILVRAGGADLLEPPAGYPFPFTDVPTSARAVVEKARYNGILSGKSASKFDPYGLASRGEVAKMVYGLMQAMR